MHKKGKIKIRRKAQKIAQKSRANPDYLLYEVRKDRPESWRG
jgi:hypothetical protein